jgi:hypothetical protein
MLSQRSKSQIPVRSLEGDNMKNYDEVINRRRNFIKSAGAAAMAFLSAKVAHGQSAAAKSTMHGSRMHDEPHDAGIWITWYDLPATGRDAYLSWLHGTYLPQLLKRPGYMWAAHYATREGVGSATVAQLHHVTDPKVLPGFRYMLLVAAKDAFVFGNPAPSALHAALPEQDRKMLAMRIGERVNLLADVGRLEGRARSTYKDGLTSAPCIQVGSYNCPFEYEEALHAGYVQSRLPAMCDTESCVRTRRLSSVSGWAKHVIIYEFASQEGFDRDYVAASAKAPLKQGNLPLNPVLVHAPNGPNSGLRLWPPISKT